MMCNDITTMLARVGVGDGEIFVTSIVMQRKNQNGEKQPFLKCSSKFQSHQEHFCWWRTEKCSSKNLSCNYAWFLLITWFIVIKGNYLQQNLQSFTWCISANSGRLQQAQKTPIMTHLKEFIFTLEQLWQVQTNKYTCHVVTLTGLNWVYDG